MRSAVHRTANEMEAFYRESLNASVETLNTTQFESLTVKTDSQPSPCIVASIYGPSGAFTIQFSQQLSDLIDQLKLSAKRYVVCRDSNNMIH